MCIIKKYKWNIIKMITIDKINANFYIYFEVINYENVILWIVIKKLI